MISHKIMIQYYSCSYSAVVFTTVGHQAVSVPCLTPFICLSIFLNELSLMPLFVLIDLTNIAVLDSRLMIE